MAEVLAHAALHRDAGERRRFLEAWGAQFRASVEGALARRATGEGEHP